jgi:hypothetical protein
VNGLTVMPLFFSSWMSWVPEALSSIRITCGLKRARRLITACFRLGKSTFGRQSHGAEAFFALNDLRTGRGVKKFPVNFPVIPRREHS